MLLMIVCEANSLNTTDLPRKTVGSETLKEQSERKKLLSMASALKTFIMSLFLPVYHGYKPTVSKYFS